MAELLDLATGPEGAFVIRAIPRGQHGLTGWGGWGMMIALWRRFVRGDKAWIVEVRRRSDDPFGAVQHAETVASKDAAGVAIARIASAVRDNAMDW